MGLEANAGQKHLHLLTGGVLGLVQDDEGIVQGAATHEGQRCDLDHAPGHQLRGPFLAHHFIQGIGQGAQIRIYFLSHVTGQKAQLFTGLHRGSGQDNPAHLFMGQG